MLGGILASPFLDDHPLIAGGFVFGCVLPDLDALSRVFGKGAFMRSHQTLSHSLCFQLFVAGVCWLLEVLWPPGSGLGWLGTGVALGMLFHVLLDYTNTLGVTLFAPFSWRRHCVEWVFFIDVTVIVISSAALSLIAWTGISREWIAGVFTGWMIAYWAARALLAVRARRRVPAGTVSLIPSPVVPWRYLGFRREEARGENFRLDAITGRVSVGETYSILDETFVDSIRELPEYRTMAALSPAYHVVAADPAEDGGDIELFCRDLRTRPIGTTFGDLRVVVASDGEILEVDLHV